MARQRIEESRVGLIPTAQGVHRGPQAEGCTRLAVNQPSSPWPRDRENALGNVRQSQQPLGSLSPKPRVSRGIGQFLGVCDAGLSTRSARSSKSKIFGSPTATLRRDENGDALQRRCQAVDCRYGSANSSVPFPGSGCRRRDSVLSGFSAPQVRHTKHCPELWHLNFRASRK